MVIRNNITGEYVRFESDDDPAAVALLDLRESTHPTEPVWAQTGVEAIEDAEANGITPSLVALVPPTATAANDTQPLGTVQDAANISGAVYIPNENITGVATNSRSLLLKDGANTIATLAFVSGVNGVADEPSAFTVATEAVVEGDVLTVESESVGTGLADPGGLVIVTFAGNVAPGSQDFSESDADAKDE